MGTNQFLNISVLLCTAQKMKFSIKDSFSKCDQIRSRVVLVTFSIPRFFSDSKVIPKNFGADGDRLSEQK